MLLLGPCNEHTCSASSRLSNSMKAYCSESPVCLSRMTWQLMMVPNREKMSSRSSSRVTAFSLHTKRTFSGGLTLAKGRSPTISSVNAEAAAALFLRSFSSSSSGNVCNGSSSSAMRVELSGGFIGGESGTTSRAGSSKGSSERRISRGQTASVKKAYPISLHALCAHPLMGDHLGLRIHHSVCQGYPSLQRHAQRLRVFRPGSRCCPLV